MFQTVKKTGSGIVSAASSVHQWFGGGFKGLARGGVVGLGVAFELSGPSRQYGTGYAIGRGIGYSIPTVGTAMMIYDIGKSLGDAAWDYQRQKRQSSFTRGFQDPYQTAATMRARSQYNLSRGRASLSSEAYLFHG